MALRAVPDHPKFARLKSLIGKGKAETLGYLECLWHFCGRFTPRGNVGKYADADIEAWLEWDGDEGELVGAFVRAGWIDVCAENRLVVHDWAEHADNATKMAIKRSNLTFVSMVSPQCLHTVNGPGSTAPTVLLPPVPEPEPVPEPVPDTPPLPPSPGGSTPRVPRVKFIPPTGEDCEAYAVEIGMSEEQGREFFDYWTSANWKRKNGPVVDWKATMRVRKAHIGIQPPTNGKGQTAADVKRRALAALGVDDEG